MKNLTFALALISLNCFADFHCSYPTDGARGVSVPRILLSVNDEGACMNFLEHKGGKPISIGHSCGSYNFHHGVRSEKIRFDGFEDFTSQSHVSIPPAKVRFGVLDVNTATPRFLIKGDRRVSPDIEYVCDPI